MILILKNKKKIMIISCSIIIFIIIFFTGIKIDQLIKWGIAVEAVGTLPYQIGLTNVKMIKCITTGYPPLCEGGELCYIKDAISCTNYFDVSGTPAGGMGYNALFSLEQTTMAGLYPKGELIAGGISPVLMDSGVLASIGGCYGCVAQADKFKINDIFKYFITGFKYKY